jgi:hypothetical protein
MLVRMSAPNIALGIRHTSCHAGFLARKLQQPPQRHALDLTKGSALTHRRVDGGLAAHPKGMLCYTEAGSEQSEGCTFRSSPILLQYSGGVWFTASSNALTLELDPERTCRGLL